MSNAHTARAAADRAAELATWVRNAEHEDEAAARAEVALRELTELGQSLPYQARPPLREAYREIRALQADIYAEWDAQQRAEIAAEYGWLRAAEAPTAEDYAFEQWERARIDPAEDDRIYGDAPYC